MQDVGERHHISIVPAAREPTHSPWAMSALCSFSYVTETVTHSLLLSVRSEQHIVVYRRAMCCLQRISKQ